MRSHPLLRARRAFPILPFLVLLGVLALPVHPARAAWLLTGTCVAPDHLTAVAGVRVTLFPDSISTVSDAQGDFLLSWTGKRGWLTVVPETKLPDGSEWCKRIVLHPRTETKADSTFDVGQTIVVVTARLSDIAVAQHPPGVLPPASFALPGPGKGEPDTCRVRMVWQTDIWGRVVSVTRKEGDSGPADLVGAIEKWIRSVQWKTPAETRCGRPDPITGTEWFSYAWKDTAWVYAPMGTRYRQ